MTVDNASIRVSAQGMIRNFGEEAYAKALENAEGFSSSSMEEGRRGGAGLVGDSCCDQRGLWTIP